MKLIACRLDQTFTKAQFLYGIQLMSGGNSEPKTYINISLWHKDGIKKTFQDPNNR